MPGTSGTLVGIECDISGTFLFGGIVEGRGSTNKKIMLSLIVLIAVHDSRQQSFYHSAKLLSSFQHIPNNFRCQFRGVRSYDKEVITRLISYRHLYQALG